MTQSSTTADSLNGKYDGTTPDYTCYPTASQFHSAFGADQFRHHAEQSNMGLLPKDLALCIHIPFSGLNDNRYRPTISIAPPSDLIVTQFLAVLNKEIALRSQLFNNDRLVKRVYFSGATSSYLNVDQIADILDQIASQFHLDLPSKVQMSIQLDPSQTTQNQVQQLSNLGFNRFSIGVQCMSSEVLIEMTNESGDDNTLAIIGAAAEVSKTVNVELTRGLPQQTRTSFTETLNSIIATRVARITVRDFVPNTVHFCLSKDCGLATRKTNAALIKITDVILKEAGYQYIGMGLFALANDALSVALSNNFLHLGKQGYTSSNDIDTVGFGLGSVSYFDSAYAQNESSFTNYCEQVDDNNLPIEKGLALTEDDHLCAQAIQQIMSRYSVDLNQNISRYIDRESKITLLEYFKPEMQKLGQLKHDGLIVPTENGFNLTDLGRYYTQAIAMQFDHHVYPIDRSSKVVPLLR